MSIKNLYDKTHNTFAFDADYLSVIGTPESSGTWLIYGAEKNGKTWAALMLANYLSKFTHVLYISAEQGADKDFVEAVKRAGISHTNKKLYVVDGSVGELNTILEKKVGKRHKTKIVFIDNITFYLNELKHNKLQHLQRKYPDVLFIYLAHEEQNKPYGATAQMCKRLAKIIIRVQGLQAQVSGRCPGGIFNIDDTKAQLYWGVNQNN
jgi:DNA polymerase III delta prime subunit